MRHTETKEKNVIFDSMVLRFVILLGLLLLQAHNAVLARERQATAMSSSTPLPSRSSIHPSTSTPFAASNQSDATNPKRSTSPQLQRDSIEKCDSNYRPESITWSYSDSLRRCLTHGTLPQPTPPKHLYGQTVDSQRLRSIERNRRFYDSLAAKSSRYIIPRLLYKALIVKPSVDTTSHGRVVAEDQLFAPYHGMRIGEIAIAREQVFAPDGNWLDRTGNKLHVMTRERVIRRDLLFNPGDTVDPQLLVRNLQLLRSRPYISDVTLELIPDPVDSTTVNVLLHTRDSWTISVDGALHGEGRTMVGLYDANILGTGNKLSIDTHFSRSDFSYGGNIVAYEIPNLLGTFYTADFSAGRDFYNSELRLGLRKEFIRPTDYEIGATYDNIKEKLYLIDRDSSELTRIRTLNLWAGRSRYVESIRSSLFFTGRYNRTRHPLRPEVGPALNPAFHDADNLLFGIGLYRERFYTTNLVYGYGTREFIATGYKAELNAGYTWDEFGRAIYLGTGVKGGGFRPLGYMMGGIALGSYIDPHTGAWQRCAVDIDLRWFSHLFVVRRSRIRQFASINYTQGWNRDYGCNEIIGFTDQNGLRTLQTYVTGINRAVMNTETVLFTPYQPLGFRIALYGFADFGLLGYNANPFRNEFFASFGIGIRLRNERLIFSAIQFELGFAVSGRRGWIDSNYMRLSNQNRLEESRYLPTRPEFVAFE